MTFTTLSKSSPWRRLHVAVLFSAAVLATAPAGAQTSAATVGTIVGRVTDAKSKMAYDGVRVTVTVNGVNYETTTDQQGGYVLVNVPAGDTTASFNYLVSPPRPCRSK